MSILAQAKPPFPTRNQGDLLLTRQQVQVKIPPHFFFFCTFFSISQTWSVTAYWLKHPPPPPTHTVLSTYYSPHNAEYPAWCVTTPLTKEHFTILLWCFQFSLQKFAPFEFLSSIKTARILTHTELSGCVGMCQRATQSHTLLYSRTP